MSENIILHQTIFPVIKEEKYGFEDIPPYQLNNLWGLIDLKGNIIFKANLQSDTIFSTIGSFGMKYGADPFHNRLYSPLTRAIVKKQNGKF